MMKKQWLAALVAVAVAGGLSACGGKSGDAGAKGDVIRIATGSPLSGGQASAGLDFANGAVLAAEEINAKGGLEVGGKKYKIGIVPQINIQRGEIIKITETKILNKVKLFEFKENGNIKKVNLSFLLDSYVLVFSILTLFVTICYVYKNHPLTEFALSVFSVLNFALTFIYF